MERLNTKCVANPKAKIQNKSMHDEDAITPLHSMEEIDGKKQIQKYSYTFMMNK